MNVSFGAIPLPSLGRRQRPLSWLQNCCVTYLALWATAPPLAFSPVSRYLAVLAIFFWFIAECSRSRGVVRRPTVSVCILFLYFVYTSLGILIFEGVSILNADIQLYIMLIFILFMQSRRREIESMEPTFWMLLLTFPVWQILTIKEILTSNTHAARILIRSSTEAADLMGRGVGGYSLVYASLLLFPSVLVLFLNPKAVDGRKLLRPFRYFPFASRIIIIGNTLSALVLVIVSGYSIAAISIVVVTFSVLFIRNYSPYNIVCCMLLTVCCYVVFYVYIEQILLWLLPLTHGSNFNLKIRDILISMQEDSASGTLYDRIERYQRSFLLFVQNPIFGTMSSTDIGKHSQILDNFAQFGIVVGSMFVYLLITVPVMYIKRRGAEFGLAFAMLIVTLLYFGLNNAFMSAGPVLFIIFPVAANMIRSFQCWKPRRSVATTESQVSILHQR